VKNLTIEATDITPAVDFNADTQVLRITGESYPENVAMFFNPVIVWLEEFLAADNDRSILMEIELTMFNSSTSKVLWDMVYALNEAAPEEASIVVNWRYHELNDLVEEFGEDLQEDNEALTVKMVPITD